MNIVFEEATVGNIKARVALDGPSGSGKTWTALEIATRLGKNVFVIDTEHDSARRYADAFRFRRANLVTHHPMAYVEAITAAENAGADVIVVDSLSHAWVGKDGALALVDKAAAKAGNSYTAWREVTPFHNALVDKLIRCSKHLVVTIRTKTAYVMEVNERGKSAPRKIGMEPIQRDGLEYEFDIVGDLDMNNTLTIGKTRCRALAGKFFAKPSDEPANTIKAWVTTGIQEGDPRLLKAA